MSMSGAQDADIQAFVKCRLLNSKRRPFIVQFAAFYIMKGRLVRLCCGGMCPEKENILVKNAVFHQEIRIFANHGRRVRAPRRSVCRSSQGRNMTVVKGLYGVFKD